MSYNLGPNPVTPVERLFLLNDDQKWEDFIEDCVIELKNKENYKNIIKLGGAGDKGRDICAYLEVNSANENTWDLYQAKYYNSESMNPTNFYPELAKFFDMLISGEYTKPRKYYLCALKIGSTLHDLFMESENFKTHFLEKIEKNNGVFSNYTVKAEINAFKKFVKDFNFTIFHYFLPKDLIAIHSTSPKHWEKFGELPRRGEDPALPISHENFEEIYINELLALYNSITKGDFTLDTLAERHKKHLNAQRKVFFMAEGLKRFSRDKIPNAFDDLLKDLLTSIEVILFNIYQNNMEKHIKIIEHVNSCNVSNNPLSLRLKSGDLAGCCHHLVNDQKLKWVDDEDL